MKKTVTSLAEAEDHFVKGQSIDPVLGVFGEKELQLNSLQEAKLFFAETTGDIPVDTGLPPNGEKKIPVIAKHRVADDLQEALDLFKAPTETGVDVSPVLGRKDGVAARLDSPTQAELFFGGRQDGIPPENFCNMDGSPFMQVDDPGENQ